MGPATNSRASVSVSVSPCKSIPLTHLLRREMRYVVRSNDRLDSSVAASERNSHEPLVIPRVLASDRVGVPLHHNKVDGLTLNRRDAGAVLLEPDTFIEGDGPLMPIPNSEMDARQPQTFERDMECLARDRFAEALSQARRMDREIEFRIPFMKIGQH